MSIAGDRRLKEVHIHWVTGLRKRDVRIHQGIPVTSPARTILDQAPSLSRKSLTRAVDNARLERILTLGDLADVAERFALHPGAPLLKPFLNTEGGPTRSEWEDAFPAWCAEHGLPPPAMGAVVAGHEVDALFAEEKVIVELDSWEFHQDRGAFESDRDRDADTLAAGHITVRMTWGRMTTKEAARLREILKRWGKRAD